MKMRTNMENYLRNVLCLLLKIKINKNNTKNMFKLK